MAKGQNFEREMSRSLSLWFSYGEADDWFWRSSQSGGRATIRGRKGKGTAGHCGDVAATCSEGEFLTKLVTLELKKGYNADTIFNLFDRQEACGKTWKKWIAQASLSCANAKTPYWCVVHKRDHRDPIIVIPNQLASRLSCLGCSFSVFLKMEQVTVLRLKDFFQSVDPQDIKILLKEQS